MGSCKLLFRAVTRNNFRLRTRLDRPAKQAEMELKLLFLFLLSCSCQGSPCGDKDDCVNRVDEELREDYSSVLPCDNPTDWGIPKAGPGLRCGDKCVATYLWCSSHPTDCGSFTTDDAKLCQNYTFWNNQDCNQYVNDGRVTKYGKRCTGQRMECNYPAYMSYDYDYNRQCSDLSDQIHKLGTNCTIDQHLDIYMSHFCNQNPEAVRGRHCDEIQSDPAGWISRLREELKSKSLQDKKGNRRREIEDRLDPHNCQTSCLSPGYGCEACTNSDYFRCPVNGTESCLHPDLECDGHPQCDNAEDEDSGKCRTEPMISKKVMLFWSFQSSGASRLPSLRSDLVI